MLQAKRFYLKLVEQKYNYFYFKEYTEFYKLEKINLGEK